MLLDEEIIWEGRPSWKAWSGLTILGILLLPIIVGLVLLAVAEIRKRSCRWKITTKRIELEAGLLTRNLDTLELWRIRDIEFSQGIFDRMLKIACLKITAQDGENPVIFVRGFPGDKALYDKLMTAVINSRQQRGLLNVVT